VILPEGHDFASVVIDYKAIQIELILSNFLENNTLRSSSFPCSSPLNRVQNISSVLSVYKTMTCPKYFIMGESV
jgi:hypothetical protein